MPGAFARLGPELARIYSEDTGHSIVFAAFRPSGMLAEAILAGARADVYVSANVTWMHRLQRAGLVRHWTTLARNRLCLIAKPEVRVDTLEMLAQPRLKVVAPQAATDPCGRYVEILWQRTGLLARMREKQARGELVRSIGSGDLPGFLHDGRAQAGMLYLSEAHQLEAAQIRTIPLLSEQDMHEKIRFVITALSDGGTPFMRWLLAPEAQAQLVAWGFGARANGPGAL
jgi:molybdate transport system substrate-binding protein